MRDWGVEVVELHELLGQTLAVPAAKAWLLDRKITVNEVGFGLVTTSGRSLTASATPSWRST